MKGLKTGGRVKGTPNKTPAQVRDYFLQLVADNMDQLSVDLQSLEPKDRVKYVIELSKFVLPTLRAMDMEAKVEGFKPIEIITGMTIK